MQNRFNPITPIGSAYGRYGHKPFGIHMADRMMHLYVIGQTGTGKSTLLHNLCRQDADNGHGFCLIDPHGDLAEQLAPHLAKDAICWNLADADCPYGYNPLSNVSEALRPLVASGFIQVLKKQWPDAWGVRMEHLLRFACLALLEQPRADLRDVMRMFLDKEFRRAVLAQTNDEEVQRFWHEEFPAMNYKTAFDGVAPIANKLGGFLAHPLIRRAICTPERPLRFRKLMDEGRAMVVNLAKGRVGGDAANLFGGLIVSGLTHAAFSRYDIDEDARRPFILLVDEFHNFTTEALVDTLSEARKYGLGLVLSQQHVQQSAKDILAGVLGNCGSLIAYRLGALDAPLIANQLRLQRAEDLINLPNYQCFVRLMVQGCQSPAFTALMPPPVIEAARSEFGVC